MLCFSNCLYLLSVFKEVLPGWKALLIQLYGECTYWVLISSFIYEISRIGKPIGIENRLVAARDKDGRGVRKENV